MLRKPCRSGKRHWMREDAQAGSGGGEARVTEMGWDAVQGSLRSNSEGVLLQTMRSSCENSRGGEVLNVSVCNINKPPVTAAVKSFFFLSITLFRDESINPAARQGFGKTLSGLILIFKKMNCGNTCRGASVFCLKDSCGHKWLL